MATNSSTTTRRRSDAETTNNDRTTTESTEGSASTDTDTVGTDPAISYAGDGNTRGIELDPTTHGAHRRNNPSDI